MALLQKVDPAGLDIFIDLMQVSMFNFLTNANGPAWTDYESHHRAYKNPSKDKTIPEVYTSDGEYKEVLFNDEFNVTSFFLSDDSRIQDKELVTQNISMIFQAKLSEIYPNITHRADEEMNFDILNAAKAFPQLNESSIKMTTGIKNVYKELNLQSMVDFDDMSNFHVVKIDMEARYYAGCENKSKAF